MPRRTANGRRPDDLDEFWFEKIVVTTKTAEEIREHTIAADLSPVAKTLAMLDSRSDIQRLAGIRSISSVIISDRDETFNRILPKFKAIIEQTLDNGEHSVAAEAIVCMIEQKLLSYSEFMLLFSPMICKFVFPTTTNRFSTDFGHIWCQALCNIIDAFPNTTSINSLLDLVFNHSLHGSYVRDRLAIILAKLSTRLNAQTIENRLLPVFKNFINDTNSDIRALACQELPILARLFESNQMLNLILPLFVILSKDDNINVRQTCFESLLDLSNSLNDSRSIEQVSDMIIALIKFGLSSRTLKFVSTIAIRLHDLCHALTIFRVDEYQFIRETFLRLSQEKQYSECRLACAKHFSSVIDYLGPDELTNGFEELFFELCNDNDTKVCATMLSTIINLTKLCDDNKEKKYMSTIWNGFASLLSNSNLNVMLSIATNLLNIFIAYSRNQEEGFAHGSICSTPVISDSDRFINQLLDYERQIFETTLSWRSCILCLQAFAHLPYLLSSEQIQTKILPRVFQRIYSKQVCVRDTAVDIYVQLLRKIPRRSIRRTAFQKLKAEFLLNKSYQWRIMYIKVCRQILVHYSKRFFKENFLDTIISIEYDPVLSVRIQLVPLLVEIKSILRLPADLQSISKIETMMEYFLADKTLTLHDLANNGLLQLDQIRSYNTLSLSNHSTDDKNDQQKENEEYFLDEIDISSRRSLNKSSEPYSISKRLTDTSISTKQQTSLRTSQLLKTSADIHRRKSSLPTDAHHQSKDNKVSVTKQRRGQTFTDATTSSRLIHQTSTKKNSKYSISRRHSDTDTMMQPILRVRAIEPTRQPFNLSFAENDVPQLFCQLDVLRRSEEESEYAYWKEKARWVRFEEIAENVLGRWSKPHVATLMQTALLDLKNLLSNGVILLNAHATDLGNLSQTMVQALIDANYIDDVDNAQKLLRILGLPHFHHHEKRSVMKTASSVSLTKQQGLHPSPSFVINHLSKREDETDMMQDMSAPHLISKPSSHDMALDELDETNTAAVTPSAKDYNTKLQRKLSRKTEGASILICPVTFVRQSTVVVVRLENALELLGMLEIKLYSRFLVLLIGPEENEKQLLQVGRTMATILTDDICREFAYTSKDSAGIMSMMDRFMQDTYVIPPSEWDPTIRIEPPSKYMSKEQRQQAPEEKAAETEEIDLTPHADPNLKASKRPFYGLFCDIRNKLPYYVSDFTDCASLKCIAATIYLYLVCLCSVVAFGGMLGTATNNYMATMECILSASVSGIIYALFSGQPLNILSATGPMLILERILKTMCHDYGFDFLEFRLWIGIWVCVMLSVFVTFNLSFLVKYITRFTEDCFASLVALIFIFDAIREILHIRVVYPINYAPKIPLNYSCFCKIAGIGVSHNKTVLSYNNTINYLVNAVNLNETSKMACKNLGGRVFGAGCTTPDYHPDIFFLSVLLFVFTFFICMGLQEFRTSSFFPSKIRSTLGDFSVLIAIVTMSAWDAYLRLDTPKLQVPKEFKPTLPNQRGWLVPFFGKNSLWAIPIAIIPAIIATILIFMDQQITAVIINRKEFKLKKKLGYHLDLFVLSISILVQSLLGLPWFVAATVLALTHVNALKIMSENSAPGEKPKFEGILEQRVSALLMSILTGLSVLFTNVLGFIPMPVLYAVFMFMGVSAIRNMQIFDRVLLILMPQKHQPDHPYLRHVRITRVHLFTIIQIISLAGMFAIKSIKSIALGFPLLVLATCFVRKLLDKMFTQEELFWLDDILPGTKIGRIRRKSIVRNVHMPKPGDDDNKETITLPKTKYNTEVKQDGSGNSLKCISEIINNPSAKQDYINDDHMPNNDSGQLHTPLIVVTEALPSEESAAEEETVKSQAANNKNNQPKSSTHAPSVTFVAGHPEDD
ncbi:unnamed protein product [Rotaria socialis]|uniref:Anion exchange protein n=2 Tax=Rotaria socialis TaxID=392032 RepID=A0A817RC57_9BILA|nr:unnamed protein product [Rotaria socialis]